MTDIKAHIVMVTDSLLITTIGYGNVFPLDLPLEQIYTEHVLCSTP